MGIIRFCFSVLVIFLVFNIKSAHAVGKTFKSSANSSYYIDFERKFTWFDSHLECTRRNMKLVEINTNEKSKDLESLLKTAETEYNLESQHSDYLWTGAVLNIISNKTFAWISTAKKLNYSNWYDGNPDFYNHKEFCVELVRVKNWRWNDDDCYTKAGFICEYPQETQAFQNNTEQQVKQQMRKEIAEEFNRKQELNQPHQSLSETLRENNKIRVQNEIQTQIMLLKQLIHEKNNLLKFLQTQNGKVVKRKLHECAHYLDVEMEKQLFKNDLEIQQELEAENQELLKALKEAI